MNSETQNYDKLLTAKLGEIGLVHRYEPVKNGKKYRHVIVKKKEKSWWNFLKRGERLVAIVTCEPDIPKPKRSFRDLKYGTLEIDVLRIEFLPRLELIAQNVGEIYGGRGSVKFKNG